MGHERTLFVIAYDLPNDKRRSQVRNLLSGYCTWTQYSLFEGFLTEKERLALEAGLRKILNEKEDSVRFYPLCAADVKRVVTIGSPEPRETKAIVI